MLSHRHVEYHVILSKRIHLMFVLHGNVFLNILLLLCSLTLLEIEQFRTTMAILAVKLFFLLIL